MFIRSVQLEGFRGLYTTIELANPMALVVGENNAGKSSIIDSIRLVLGGSETNEPNRLYVRESDFTFDSTGEYIEPRSFRIHLDIGGLTPKQQGRMITCLTPSAGPGCARLSLEASWDGVKRPQVYVTGGEHGNREVEALARQAIKCLYLPPLRDAARDLRPGPSNRLRQLVNHYAQPKGDDRERVVAAMVTANQALTEINAIKLANQAVSRRLDGITGSQAFKQNATVTFSDPTYDRIVGNLRALMGIDTPMELESNGLGLNNILYMSVLLSAMQDIDETSLYVLLIEEPEAHLHPQLQELLATHLSDEAGEQIQVIASTHSPHFASSSPLQSITVVSRNGRIQSKSVSLGSIPIEPEKLRYLRRFLDVTKASLFFAKGVILVEGIAEQILMPVFARICGVDLDASGVSVINVGGLNFSSFVSLFGKESLPIRCSVVTDSDRTWTTPEPDTEGAITDASERDSIPKNSAYAQRAVSEFENDFVRVFLAQDTLEKDIVQPFSDDQKLILIRALTPVRPVLAERLKTDPNDNSSWLTEFYRAVESHKGDFAQSLSTILEDRSSTPAEIFVVPPYIERSIKWACGLEESAPLSDDDRESDDSPWDEDEA